MARSGAEKMLDYRRRKREQGLRLVQLVGVRPRLARVSSPGSSARPILVRGHESTREANAFLAELWDERLDAAEAASD